MFLIESGVCYSWTIHTMSSYRWSTSFAEYGILGPRLAIFLIIFDTIAWAKIPWLLIRCCYSLNDLTSHYLINNHQFSDLMILEIYFLIVTRDSESQPHLILSPHHQAEDPLMEFVNDGDALSVVFTNHYGKYVGLWVLQNANREWISWIPYSIPRSLVTSSTSE